MALTARSSVGRDLLLEVWLSSQMQARTKVTAEEFCRASEELAPAWPPATTPNRPLPLPAIPA